MRRASSGERVVARHATGSTGVLMGRVGFVARGAVYMMIGWLALQAAVGIGEVAPDQPPDQQGAFQAILQQPAGVILLGLVAIGLFAYAAWSLVRAVFDPERLGHDAGATVTRVGYGIAAISYAGLALAAANLALGSGAAQGSDAKTQDWTARLLSAPFGPPLVIAVGVIMLVVAAIEFIRAYTADFQKQLSLAGLGPDLRTWIVRVGRMGLAARGVVFALIGLFLIQAARHDDPSQAVGLGGALQKLAEQEHGEIFLAATAVGLFMYGLFSFVEARYRRLKR